MATKQLILDFRNIGGINMAQPGGPTPGWTGGMMVTVTTDRDITYSDGLILGGYPLLVDFSTADPSVQIVANDDPSLPPECVGFPTIINATWRDWEGREHRFTRQISISTTDGDTVPLSSKPPYTPDHVRVVLVPVGDGTWTVTDGMTEIKPGLWV